MNHMDLRTKTNLVRLKGKIKGLAEEIRRNRVALKEWPRPVEPNDSDYLSKRWTTRMVNRSVAVETRNYLLAYGLLRGMPYSAIEPKRSVKPNAEAIMKIIHEHLPSYEVEKWTLEMIESMLDVETEEVAADSRT